MYAKETSYVTLLILTSISLVIAFAFVVGSVGAADTSLYIEDSEVVLDEDLVISDSIDVLHSDGKTLGYRDDLSRFEGSTPNLVAVGDIYASVYGSLAGSIPSGSVIRIVDAMGDEVYVTLTKALTSGRLSSFVSSADAAKTVYAYGSTVNPIDYGMYAYSASTNFDSDWFSVYWGSIYESGKSPSYYSNTGNNIIFSFDTPVSTPFSSGAVSSSQVTNGIRVIYYTAQQYAVFKEFEITPPVGGTIKSNYYSSGTIIPIYNAVAICNSVTGEVLYGSSLVSDPYSFPFQYYPSWREVVDGASQNLYVLKSESEGKYYLWLFRYDVGSSLVLEGKASAGLPLVTLVNGGSSYTDNYYVTLDMYDAFGVGYEYDIQITAFDSDNAVKKFTYTFGSSGSSGDTDDDFTPIVPPGIIEIPDIIGGVVTEPGQLPSLTLPFDFTAPVFAVDFTSSFDYAFNNTWLGVADVYADVQNFLDNLVVKFVPDVSGVFGSSVYTIETYSDAFVDTSRELRNTYAVPFYNLFVKFSSLVPSVVWVVFDIWLFYCCARLVVWVFTCPLSEVIRRYF